MENNIVFDAKITEKDLFRYNLLSAYTSFQGLFSIAVLVFLLTIWGTKFPTLPMTYKIVYPIVAIGFVLYLPFELKIKVKKRFSSGIYDVPLHYDFSVAKIVVSSSASEEVVELPWEYIYKVSTFNNCLLLYTTRKNAYIIPKSEIGEQYDALMALIKKCVKEFKINIK